MPTLPKLNLKVPLIVGAAVGLPTLCCGGSILLMDNAKRNTVDTLDAMSLYQSLKNTDHAFSTIDHLISTLNIQQIGFVVVALVLVFCIVKLTGKVNASAEPTGGRFVGGRGRQFDDGGQIRYLSLDPARYVPFLRRLPGEVAESLLAEIYTITSILEQRTGAQPALQQPQPRRGFFGLFRRRS